MKNLIKSFYNELDFFFRRNIRFTRKYSGKNEPKESLFGHLSGENKKIAEEKEKLYLEKYHLQGLKDNSTCRNYLENLAVIELLESCFLSPPPYPPPQGGGRDSQRGGLCPPPEVSPKLQQYESTYYDKKNPLKILDIGSKNWFYASGEWSFFKYGGEEREIFLDGIEIDAFRVYSDFHTRYDYAQFYIKNLPNTSYLAKDFLKHQEKYDFIIWFFPFVTEFPLLEWGLPLSKFKPAEMLKHASECLNKNGKILIVNQDEAEYEIQEELIRNLNLSYEKMGEFKNSFVEFERKRYVTIVF